MKFHLLLSLIIANGQKCLCWLLLVLVFVGLRCWSWAVGLGPFVLGVGVGVGVGLALPWPVLTRLVLSCLAHKVMRLSFWAHYYDRTMTLEWQMAAWSV
jgi:hypothetical protein